MDTITRQHASPYAHRSCIASPCDTCGGTGRVWQHRATWTGEIRCETCDGYGETYVSEFATVDEAAPDPPAPAPIMFAGQVVDAPGFQQEQFERALCRALADQLEVKPDEVPGFFIVGHPYGHNYRVTRDTCQCRAGSVGMPCKHRAILCVELDIHQPMRRKAWARLNAERSAERPAETAVASC